jgi:hypothetical protein
VRLHARCSGEMLDRNEETARPLVDQGHALQTPRVYVSTCRKFFQDICVAEYLDVNDYIAQFCCARAGGTEVNEAGVLFGFGEANLAC